MQFIQAQQDRWHRPDGDAPVQPAAHLLLTLSQWRAVRNSWPPTCRWAWPWPTPTRRGPGRRPAAPGLIALHFPKWTDGRAYSQARVLRARLRFAGELRATGDVLVDMLPLLSRTGFDAVQLRAGENETSARRALTLVTEHYQGDVHQPRPQFARVA
jgi:uncharacterized protein (DUF934 family)